MFETRGLAACKLGVSEKCQRVLSEVNTIKNIMVLA